MLFLFIGLQDEYVLCQINKIKKKGGEQPLDENILNGSAFENDEWIEEFYS